MNRAQRRAQLKKLPAKSTAAMKSVAAQNRLVMIGNTDRLSEESQIDSSIKLNIMLDAIITAHDDYAVLYMHHAIKHMRLSGMLQNRPHYAEWADKAEAELAESINGNRNFPYLKRLIFQLDEEIGTTSAHLQLACNDQAAACGVIENIIGIIELPEAAESLFSAVTRGQALKSAAAELKQPEAKARQMLLDYAWYISNLSAGDIPICRSVTDIKKYGKNMLALQGRLKQAASDAAAAICQFHHRFGVSLIDIDSIVNTFESRRKAA